MAAVVTSDTQTTGNGVYDGVFVAGALASAVVLGGYALLAAHFSRASIREAYALVRPAPGWWRVAAAALLVIVVFDLALDPFLHGGEKQGIAPERPPHGSEWVTLAIAMVVIGLAVPAGEELMFRGLAFAALGRYAVVGSAALFAVAHAVPQVLPFTFVAGLALAEVRRRTGSLFPGMAVHALLNTVTVIVALLTS